MKQDKISTVFFSKQYLEEISEIQSGTQHPSQKTIKLIQVVRQNITNVSGMP